MFNKKSTEKSLQTVKHFNYKRAGLTLNFSLVIDEVESLKEFRTMLLEALDDVEDVLVDQDLKEKNV